KLLASAGLAEDQDVERRERECVERGEQLPHDHARALQGPAPTGDGGRDFDVADVDDGEMAIACTERVTRVESGVEDPTPMQPTTVGAVPITQFDAGRGQPQLEMDLADRWIIDDHVGNRTAT